MSETKRRAKYTLEFKLEAVRLVKGGQVHGVRTLGAEPLRFISVVTPSEAGFTPTAAHRLRR